MSLPSGKHAGQIPDNLSIAEELMGNVIDLEGQELVAVELGHTDTDQTTCLNVPSIGLMVAGDAACKDVNLYLAESNAQTRREWISALDKIEALDPRAVVASHKRPENDDNPRIIEQTRQYIRDFDRLAEKTRTAQELYDKMLELYPNRVNPGWALWSSARAVKPRTGRIQNDRGRGAQDARRPFQRRFKEPGLGSACSDLFR